MALRRRSMLTQMMGLVALGLKCTGSARVHDSWVVPLLRDTVTLSKSTSYLFLCCMQEHRGRSRPGSGVAICLPSPSPLTHAHTHTHTHTHMVLNPEKRGGSPACMHSSTDTAHAEAGLSAGPPGYSAADEHEAGIRRALAEGEAGMDSPHAAPAEPQAGSVFGEPQAGGIYSGGSAGAPAAAPASTATAVPAAAPGDDGDDDAAITAAAASAVAAEAHKSRSSAGAGSQGAEGSGAGMGEEGHSKSEAGKEDEGIGEGHPTGAPLRSVEGYKQRRPQQHLCQQYVCSSTSSGSSSVMAGVMDAGVHVLQPGSPLPPTPPSCATPSSSMLSSVWSSQDMMSPVLHGLVRMCGCECGCRWVFGWQCGGMCSAVLMEGMYQTLMAHRSASLQCCSPCSVVVWWRPCTHAALFGSVMCEGDSNRCFTSVCWRGSLRTVILPGLLRSDHQSLATSRLRFPVGLGARSAHSTFPFYVPSGFRDDAARACVEKWHALMSCTCVCAQVGDAVSAALFAESPPGSVRSSLGWDQGAWAAQKEAGSCGGGSGNSSSSPARGSPAKGGPGCLEEGPARGGGSGVGCAAGAVGSNEGSDSWNMKGRVCGEGGSNKGSDSHSGARGESEGDVGTDGDGKRSGARGECEGFGGARVDARGSAEVGQNEILYTSIGSSGLDSGLGGDERGSGRAGEEEGCGDRASVQGIGCTWEEHGCGQPVVRAQSGSPDGWQAAGEAVPVRHMQELSQNRGTPGPSAPDPGRCFFPSCQLLRSAGAYLHQVQVGARVFARELLHAAGAC
eukprot:1144657-Pelagomonas_calceolata.AAC.8